MKKLNELQWEGLDIGSSLRSFRETLGLSQRAFGNISDVTASAIAYVETGKTKSLSEKVIDSCISVILNDKDSITFIQEYTGSNEFLCLLKENINETKTDPYNFSIMDTRETVKFILKSNSTRQLDMLLHAKIGSVTLTKLLNNEKVGASSLERVANYFSNFPLFEYYMKKGDNFLKNAIIFFSERNGLVALTLTVIQEKHKLEVKELELQGKEQEFKREEMEFEPEEIDIETKKLESTSIPEVLKETEITILKTNPKEEVIETIVENYDYIKDQLSSLAAYSRTLKKIDTVVSTFKSIMEQEE